MMLQVEGEVTAESSATTTVSSSGSQIYLDWNGEHIKDFGATIKREVSTMAQSTRRVSRWRMLWAYRHLARALYSWPVR